MTQSNPAQSNSAQLNFPVLSEVIEADGVQFQTEARKVRTTEFSGVFHLLAVDGRFCAPPVVVISPGKWRDATHAHQSAHKHALTMADDGALSTLLDALHRI